MQVMKPFPSVPLLEIVGHIREPWFQIIQTIMIIASAPLMMPLALIYVINVQEIQLQMMNVLKIVPVFVLLTVAREPVLVMEEANMVIPALPMLIALV